MSTNSAYFVPARSFPIGEFEKRVTKVLENLEIIDGYYEEEEKLYACAGKINFEYASIHDNTNTRLIPEASTTGYGATCPACQHDVDDELYDIINDSYDYEAETGKERNMGPLPLVCSQCNTSTALNNMIFTTDAMLGNQFFQLVDVQGQVNHELHERIEAALGTDVSIVYETM